MTEKVITLIGAFLIGGFPTGIILSRLLLGQDIRQLGSGNPGAVNIWRVFGLRWGLVVVTIDILKGYIAAVYLPVGLSYLLPGGGQLSDITIGENLSQGGSLSPNSFLALTGLMAVLGHIWSPYTSGRGGKGVATSWGVVLGLYPSVAITLLILWLIITLSTRYASLASLVTAVSSPFLLVWRVNLDHWEKMMMGFLSLLIIYTHRGNLKRLLSGTEIKVGSSLRSR